MARNDLELSNDNDESKETPGDDNQGGSCKHWSLEGAVWDQNRPLNFRRHLKVSSTPLSFSGFFGNILSGAEYNTSGVHLVLFH